MVQAEDSTSASKPSSVFSPDRLLPFEVFWRDHYEWLLEQGYQLRPRYRPDWKPSWEGSKKLRIECEDGISPYHDRTLDAQRVSDGSFVMLKRVCKSVFPHEVEIGQFFSADAIRGDSSNHSVPLLDVLPFPDDDDHLVIVMPLLRSLDDPRFDTIGEVVEFFHQIFEGLRFMHVHNVAHRDAMFPNIMMDASHLFPESYHPLRTDYKRDLSGNAKHYTRTQVPVKYYFTDFGLSRKYAPEDRPPVEPIIMGGDKTVPEYATMTACDPFQIDVYTLGNLIRERFTEGSVFTTASRGFDFMKPLVADMTQVDPSKRPTMDEVVERFEAIRKGLSSWKLRTRIVKKGDTYFFGFFRAVAHWTRRISYVIRRVPPVPTP